MNPFAGLGLPAILPLWRAGTLEEFAPRRACAHARVLKSFVIE
jgi:hypothetical protein